MVHTFELSKVISRDTFNEIIRSLKLRYYRYYWFTTAYSDKGFAAIRLYKFKRKEIKTEVQEDNDFTHYYMISLSINTANMFSGYQDPHIPQSILSFTPDYVRAIYRKIFELIPCLEIYPERCFDECWKDVEDCTIENDEAWLNRKKRLNEQWLELNSFKAARIDFTFDLYTMNQQYLKLIDKGYSLRTGSFERNYYGNDEPDISENKITLSDEEPDVPDIEDFLAEIPNDESSDDSDSKANIKTYNSDLSYIYYKGKSLNINIYHKQTELEKRQLECDPNTDYNFLRIEVQVKKSKLNTLVSKFGIKGRELQYLVTPEIERYILEYYVSKLTGKGIYVTYDYAMKIIDNSSYTKNKKVRLKKVIEAVAKKHGIAKVLEQIEKGTITDLGTLQTVKRYLKEIEKLGINPVTISARMTVPKQTIKNQSGGKDLSEKILFNLVDILSTYGDQMEDYQKHGVPITDEVLEQIDKLYQS